MATHLLYGNILVAQYLGGFLRLYIEVIVRVKSMPVLRDLDDSLAFLCSISRFLNPFIFPSITSITPVPLEAKLRHSMHNPTSFKLDSRIGITLWFVRIFLHPTNTGCSFLSQEMNFFFTWTWYFISNFYLLKYIFAFFLNNYMFLFDIWVFIADFE